MNLFVGRALHLDPCQLIGNGAAASCPDQDRLHTPHMFVCLELRPSWGIWLAVRGRPEQGCVWIARDSRVGHLYWTDGTYYYDPNQMWFVPHTALEMAAQEDHSTDEKPNWLVSATVPRVLDLAHTWVHQDRVIRLEQRFRRKYHSE